MPTSPGNSLYDFAAGLAPHSSAALVLCRNVIPSGVPLTLSALNEPTNQGYSRLARLSVSDLCPNPQIVPGQLVHLLSRQLDLHNASGTDVSITGVALVIWTDPSTPIVIAAIPSALVWKAGTRIGGRLRLTALIHDEGA